MKLSPNSEPRYNVAQVLSVLIVTVGVILTTLSSHRREETASASYLSQRYLTGIGILTLALVLSGFLGVVQDKTFASYNGNSPTTTRPENPKFSTSGKIAGRPDVPCSIYTSCPCPCFCSSATIVGRRPELYSPWLPT